MDNDNAAFDMLTGGGVEIPADNGLDENLIAVDDPGARTRFIVLVAFVILFGIGIACVASASIIPKETSYGVWGATRHPSAESISLAKLGNILFGIGCAILLPGLSIAAWLTSLYRTHFAQESGVNVRTSTLVGSLRGWATWWLINFWLCIAISLAGTIYFIACPYAQCGFINLHALDTSTDLTLGISVGQAYMAVAIWTLRLMMKTQADNAEKVALSLSTTMPPPMIVHILRSSMVSIPGRDYSIGMTVVTQAQWEAVMDYNPARFKGANNPVENVSWDHCHAFLMRLNAIAKDSDLVFRLPTEEEWEYACRAGATGKYCKLMDGIEISEESLDRVAWYEYNSGNTTHPVGQKESNAFCLYDMLCNVWEWTQTADGGCRVNRGGCWFDSVGDCGSSSRGIASSNDRDNHIGFRLCAEKR